MIPTKPLFLSAAILLTACINLPEVDDPPSEEPDAGHTPALTVTLTAPSGATYTNSTVSVQLQLQGDTPEQVELLVDGQPLTTLQAPYAFTWDTNSLAEGPHQLSARARIGDKTFASEVRDVVVDRTPPQVVSRTPTPGAQDVWVRQPIQATFSEPLKPSTVTSTSLHLLVGGTEVVTAPSLSADGKTLTVTLASRVAVPQTLQLTLTPAITDLAGNPLVIPGDLWAWSLPTSFLMGGLSAVPGDTSAEAPSLQLDRQGHPFVVWREQINAANSNIYVYRWNGTDWDGVGPPLNDVATATSSTAHLNLNQQIQLDSSDSPIVAWAQSDSASRGIYVKRWSNNSWQAIGSPVNAFPSSTRLPHSLALQLDKNDRPVITWEQMSANSDLYINTWKWTGQNWMDVGGPIYIAQIEGQSYPALVLDESNNPIIAWANSSSDPALDGVLVRRWTGNSWVQLGSALKMSSQPSSQVFTPSLAIDSSGGPVVAWNQGDGNVANIYVYRWTGTVWEALGGALSAVPGNTTATPPILSKDAAGNLFISWCETARRGRISRWNGSVWEPLGAAFSSYCATAFAVDGSGMPFSTILSYPDISSTLSIVSTYRYNF